MIVDEKRGATECILFVSGDPVEFCRLAAALSLTEEEVRALLGDMDRQYRGEERGVQLSITDKTVQMVSNRKYAYIVEEMMQPLQEKTLSQAMLETLSVIAYKQPVTRSEIEVIRGVRCEYCVRELLKLGLIQELGRKDAVGRPVLFGTSDQFLRQFGLRSLDELPKPDEEPEA